MPESQPPTIEQLKTYYRFSLDDFCEEIFQELERVTDGGSGHHVSIQARSAKSAAHLLAARLIPFMEKKMQLSDENGYAIEEIA